MKITCPYCGTLFNDTKTHCPSCGAVNSAVVRTTSNQPLTIEELKRWYKERGLPPYKTTRFFIGENYQGARAFGIYKDKDTGNFVVYKNKDNGKRAVRYEGTDEAYAVNEIYQRLKEEIIQQKQLNLAKKSSKTSSSKHVSAASGKTDLFGRLAGWLGFLLHLLFSILRIPLMIVGGGFALIIVIGLVITVLEDAPKDGYYRYNDAIYYHYDHSEPEGKTDWFLFDDQKQTWSDAINADDLPDKLTTNKQAKGFFLSKEVPDEVKGYNFTDSLAYKDAKAGSLEPGYYDYQETTYYHLGLDDDLYWYYFNTDDYEWYESKTLPTELTHSSVAQDFYYTPTWDSQTQLTDFSETPYFKAYDEALERENADKDKWENDNDDQDFNWDADDDWDDGFTDWDTDW